MIAHTFEELIAWQLARALQEGVFPRISFMKASRGDICRRTSTRGFSGSIFEL
jgi:hypothetical protein